MGTFTLYWDCPECCEESSSSSSGSLSWSKSSSISWSNTSDSASSSSSSGSIIRNRLYTLRKHKNITYKLYIVDISINGENGDKRIVKNQISSTDDITEKVYHLSNNKDEIEEGEISNVRESINFVSYQDYIDYWNKSEKEGITWTL